MILKTDYENCIVTGNKKYKLTDNGDGTIVIEDKSLYAVDGDYYGAGDINKQNTQMNTLTEEYEIVDALVAKLRSYGITVSENNPTAIINAINSIASTYYGNGRTTGRNTVKNNPNTYGLYSTAQYTAVTNTSADYTTRITNARNYLNFNSFITSGESGPSVNYFRFVCSNNVIGAYAYSDPITSNQAKGINNLIKTGVNNIANGWNTNYSDITTAVSNAMAQLAV